MPRTPKHPRQDSVSFLRVAQPDGRERAISELELTLMRARSGRLPPSADPSWPLVELTQKRLSQIPDAIRTNANAVAALELLVPYWSAEFDHYRRIRAPLIREAMRGPSSYKKWHKTLARVRRQIAKVQQSRKTGVVNYAHLRYITGIDLDEMLKTWEQAAARLVAESPKRRGPKRDALPYHVAHLLATLMLNVGLRPTKTRDGAFAALLAQVFDWLGLGAREEQFAYVRWGINMAVTQAALIADFNQRQEEGERSPLDQLKMFIEPPHREIVDGPAPTGTIYQVVHFRRTTG